jgi:hypothetical protein
MKKKSVSSPIPSLHYIFYNNIDQQNTTSEQ